MITSIEKIHGIGKYDHFDDAVNLSKNQIIFGFNGSGKSTLSDIFYSLENNDHAEKLLERKTLQREDGTTPDEPYIELKTDDGDLVFSNSKWNRTTNIHVFNDKYIADYVTVISNHDPDREELILGKEVNKLLRLKNQDEAARDEYLSFINNVITNNKIICGELGAGKVKITTRTKNWTAKVNQIMNIKLFTDSQKEAVKKQLNNEIAYNENLVTIQKWKGAIEKDCLRYLEPTAKAAIRTVVNNLKTIPSVTNKEISEHISNYMSSPDVNWLIAGMRNRVGTTYCPFCGQELKTRHVERLSRQLNKYITTIQKKKANAITELMNGGLAFFDPYHMKNILDSVRMIKEENENVKLLHSPGRKLLYEMQIQEMIDQSCLQELNRKITQKMNNPYSVQELTDDEKKCIETLIMIVSRLQRFQIVLQIEEEKIQNKIVKSKEVAKTRALFQASFGENSDNFKQMIESAKKVTGLQKKIVEYQEKIDALAETQRIDGINNILDELNVNYRVKVQNRKFFVQIHGYVPAEYQKDNQVLCSEGERKMLAFAYFMQKVNSDSSKKIVVIDDPISSLDMSRKSIVAYIIVKMMESADNQIILLSHDISFIEKVKGLESGRFDNPSYKMICNNNGPIFTDFDVYEYLISDTKVYENIIKSAEESKDNNDRILALMAMRPYAYIKLGCNQSNAAYKKIENFATYFHHSVYANTKKIYFDAGKYDSKSLRQYCQEVKDCTDLEVSIDDLIPDDFTYDGMNYQRAWQLYDSIKDDSMLGVRKKALVFRVLLEATLFLLGERKKFDPAHIGSFYDKALRGQKGTKLKYCKKMKKMYDLSKKYHHGPDEDGSTLGLAALNPDEMAYFDNNIRMIHQWIDIHPEECNQNDANY